MTIRAAAIAIALLSPTAALAAGWTTDGASAAGAKTAGFSDGGSFSVVWLSCARSGPGTLDLVFTGLDPSLPKDVDFTVALSVEGTAYLQTTRSLSDPREGDTDLWRTASFSEFLPLIAAMKKGKSVEISSPAGRLTLPLTGSGKALSALEAGCKG